MLQITLECSRLFKNIPDYFKIFQIILECSKSDYWKGNFEKKTFLDKVCKVNFEEWISNSEFPIEKFKKRIMKSGFQKVNFKK